MPSSPLEQVSVAARANVYFAGRCVSHAVTMPDGARKSVGVVLPGPTALRFATAAAEVMECVEGDCEWRMTESDAWQRCGPGERFAVPADSAFELRCGSEPFHYICHFG